jgi:hypothetical protein
MLCASVQRTPATCLNKNLENLWSARDQYSNRDEKPRRRKVQTILNVSLYIVTTVTKNVQFKYICPHRTLIFGLSLPL